MSINAGEVKDAVEKAVDEFAAKGYRSLGVTRADEENKCEWWGVTFIRRASPRCQSHDSERPSNGCERQDGYRRSNGNR